MILSLLASAGGGFLLSLSFPPARIDLFAWIAFVPLYYCVESSPRASAGFLSGTVFGLVFFLFDVSWIYRTLAVHGHFAPAVAGLLFAAMVLTLALFPAIFGLLLAFFSSKGFRPSLTGPFLWTCLEYVRAVAFTGFPWDLTGYSQVERLAVVQIADVTGVYGISFLILLVNGAVWELARGLASGQRPPWKLMVTAGSAIALVLAYGEIRLNHFSSVGREDQGLAVGVLQANIPQEVKWTDGAREYTFRSYERLGESAVKDEARLLVWPETAVPVLFGTQERGWKRPGEISQKLRVPMLVGAPSVRMKGSQTHYYNSAFLLDGPSLRYRYDKIHLVPFGEYMPLTWLLPLGPGIAAREADYSPGEAMTVMSVEGYPPFSVLICYEAIFPELSRAALKKGARMLINITNDGWFGATAAPYQHLGMARLRSVENRVWLVRCANTGVSAAFDPAGRLIKSIPLNEEGFFVARVPNLSNAGSLYTRMGDLFVWGCMTIVGILALQSANFVSMASVGRFALNFPLRTRPNRPRRRDGGRKP